jgi:peptidoglycan/LPS O-acetylase OafA/YrhL
MEQFQEGQRVPSLDGMRAVAIGIVVLAHSLGTRYFAYRKQVYQVVGDLGPLGVRVFFIISGFLITSILLKELAGTGTLSLSRFYFRRAFRIFPAFYCFLGVMCVLNFCHVISIPYWDRITAATYTINYREQRQWFLTHCWSLAVEEQFYLVWPLALFWLGRRRALLGAMSILIIVPLLRVLTAVLLPGHRSGIPWEFHTVCDGLATGCLLAGFRDRLAGFSAYRKALNPAFVLLAASGIFAVSFISYHNYLVRILIGPTLMNLQLAWILDMVITHHGSRVGRFLNCAPVTFVGVLSYSLYLWQQPFLHRSEHTMMFFPLNILLAFGMACLSYFCVERPCLRLRNACRIVRAAAAPNQPRHPPVASQNTGV